MSKCNIQRKLQKLLALSASPNASEAEAAMNKCQALMKKHNIRTVDIDVKERTANISEQQVRGMSPEIAMWESSLAAAIAQCFDAISLLDKRPDRGSMIFIAGDTEIGIIAHLFKHLRRIISKKAAEYAENNYGNKQVLTHNYSVGMVSTVYSRLKEIYVDTPNTTDLIVIKKDAIQTHIKKTLGEIEHKDLKATVEDSYAYFRGMQDGKTIRIQKELRT